MGVEYEKGSFYTSAQNARGKHLKGILSSCFVIDQNFLTLAGNMVHHFLKDGDRA